MSFSGWVNLLSVVLCAHQQTVCLVNPGTWLILVGSSSVEGAPAVVNQQLWQTGDDSERRYMGFYATELVETWAKHGSRDTELGNFSRWLNLISSVNASFLVRAKATHPGFVTLLNTKWLFFTQPHNATNRKFLLQVPAPLLQQRLAAIAPLVANGSIDGIDFGDELVAPFSNISAVVAAARQALGPQALLYTNEGADVFTGGGSTRLTMPLPCQKSLRKGCEQLCGTPDCCWWPHVPAGLTLVGFDMYAANGTAEVAAVREYAEACVFPSMHSGQRFVTVPGCFAQRNATTTPQQVDAEDAAIADKVDEYAAWVVDDMRIGGVKPWHWDDRAMTEEGGRFWLGAKSLPKARKRLEVLGQTLIKQDTVTEAETFDRKPSRVKSDDESSATAVWASHPVAANQTLMLQIYGASTSSKVAVEAWSESTATWDSSAPLLAPESASTSGLAVVLPATSVGAGDTKDYTAYRVTVDGGKPIAVNTPEVWWTLGDNGNSATNGGKGWVRIFGRSVALGDGPSQLKLTHSSDLGISVVIPMDKTFNHTGRYCAKFPIPSDLAVGD